MKVKTVLFMCPQNAARSVLAAAYCRRMITERQLNWQILMAGTDPDDSPAAPVVALLQSEGLAVPDEKPHRVTEGELAAADWIISMGCDLNGIAPPETAVFYWNDIPSPSQDLSGAKEAIINNLEPFLDQIT
jgi:protein-tyrosine-phosphatase